MRSTVELNLRSMVSVLGTLDVEDSTLQEKIKEKAKISVIHVVMDEGVQNNIPE